MTKTIIHVGSEELFAIFGRDGERWVRGRFKWAGINPDGKTCLFGAIWCGTDEKGDAYIIEAVGNRFDFGIEFADGSDGWGPIRDRIAQGFVITDDMLEATFGLNWIVVVRVLRTVAAASRKQIEQLSRLCGDGWGAAWSATYEAARMAPRYVARDIALNYSGVVTEDAARIFAAADGVHSAQSAAQCAAQDVLGISSSVEVWELSGRVAGGAAGAAAACGILAKFGFESKHYGVLMAPLVSVFGAPFAPAPKA